MKLTYFCLFIYLFRASQFHIPTHTQWSQTTGSLFLFQEWYQIAVQCSANWTCKSFSCRQICCFLFVYLLFFCKFSFTFFPSPSLAFEYVLVQGLKITVAPSPKVWSHFVISLQGLGCSPKSILHVTLADEEISGAIGGRAFCLWHIRLSMIFFSAPEWHVHVHLTFDIEGMPFCCSLWDCDSAFPNLNWWCCGSSTKSSLYLSGLYMCTNRNCFTLPVLGKPPGKLREGKKYYSNVSTSPRTKSLCP